MASSSLRPPGSIFRDAKDGAAARRAELLRARRAQLAVQPLEIRELYVSRLARSITGLFVFSVGMMLLIGGMDRAVYQSIASFLPGRSPAPLATLFAVMLLGGWSVYFMARAWAERRYADAMRRAIAETHDVYSDIDRLEHLHPDRVGQAMAGSLAMMSRALPMVATLILAPLAYVWSREVLAHGWPTATWLDAELRMAAPSMLPQVIVLSAISILLCRGFRPGHTVARLWRPAAWTAAVVVPLLSTTLCRCVESAAPVGLAGMTVAFAFATWWAVRSDPPPHSL